MLERIGDMGVAAVGVRCIKKAQAIGVAVLQEGGESGEAEVGLMRLAADADRAGAHGEAGRLDAGAAEGDGIRGGKFLGGRGQGEEALGEGGRVEREGSGGVGGVTEETATAHEGLLR